MLPAAVTNLASAESTTFADRTYTYEGLLPRTALLHPRPCAQQ